MADDFDISSLLQVDPTAEERNAAMVKALRGQAGRAPLAQGMSLAGFQPAAEIQQAQSQNATNQLIGIGEKQQERRIQGIQALRAIKQLESEIGHRQFEEGQATTRLGLEQAKAEKELHPPVPEQEGSKLESMKASGPLIDQAEAAFNKYITTPITSPNEKRKAYQDYEAFLNGSISNIAAGAAPAARENEELMKGFRSRFPDAVQGIASPQAAKVFFDSQRQAIKGNLAKQSELLQSGPYNRKQVKQIAGPNEAAPPLVQAPKPTETKTVNGKNYGKINGKWHEL